MIQTFKRRLACSSSALTLACLVATAALAAATSPAAAQTDQASTGQASPAQPKPMELAQAQTAPAAAASSAAAGEEVQEIIVTARLRREDIQKVPESINYLSGQALQQLQVTRYQDLQNIVPSVNIVTAYGENAAAIYLRNYPATAYFSEVPIVDAEEGYLSALYDIGSVQTLDGPQGTLFGRSALGGAVLFTPNHPNLGKYQAGVDIMMGNLGLANFNGYVNIPLINDHLAIRVAAERQHTDGYTSMAGTSQLMDSVNNEGLRVSAEWRPFGGRFDNYLMAQWFDANQTPTSRIPAAYNPLSMYYNIGASGVTYNGVTAPFVTAATYAATCATSVTDGFFTSVPACEQQRLGVLAKVFASVQQGVAMERAGDVRTELADFEPNAPLINQEDDINLTDITNFDLVKWDSSDISVHNVFWMSWYRNLLTSWSATNNFVYYTDGGGQQVQLPTVDNANGLGGFGTPSLGPYNIQYSDEFQIHGAFDKDLLVWVMGVYAFGNPQQPNRTSTGELNLTFGGANTVNEGPIYQPNLPNGSWASEWGEYAQATLDLRWLVKGLHFTAGIRDSQSYSEASSNANVYNYITDTVSPGVLSAPVVAQSHGINWTLALDYDITSNLMAYVTSRQAYVPGGINPQVASVQGLPGYVPTYGPEKLLDYELGAKYRFNFGDVHGFVDLDAYRSNFSNIDVALSAYTVLGGVTGYTANAAAAVKEGVEFQGELFPLENLDIYATAAYADDFYTSYQGSDPLSLVTKYDPTKPICLANPAGTPAGTTPTTCILNLANNPFAYAPSWTGSLRIRYTVPLGGDLGNVVPSISVNGQSREWFSTIAAREIQGYGPQVAPGISQGPHAVVNARLEWNDMFGSKATVALFVNNLFDSVYARGGVDALQSLTIASLNFAPPRIFGFELIDNF